MKKYIPIISILILGLTLRLVSLNQSLWLDEAINVRAVQNYNYQTLITDYSLGDFHPPLFHLILKPWTAIFGTSEISVRFPSLIFGLLTINYLYQIARLVFDNKSLKLQGKRIPLRLIPPLLLAVSGLHIYYSQEARMYSLAAFGVTASFYYFLTHIDPKKKLATQLKTNLQKPFHNFSLSTNSLLFILFLSLTIYTDYLVWFLLPLFFIFLPIQTAIAFLTTAPWWPFFLKQLGLGTDIASNYPAWGRVVGGFSLKSLALIPVKFTLGRVSVANNLHFALILVPILLIISYLVFAAGRSLINKKTNPHAKLITTWFFLPLVIGTTISLKISVFSYFRFLFLLPAFYLLLVYGLKQIATNYRPIIFTAIFTITLASSLVYLFNPTFHRENWRGFSNYIDSRHETSAVTVFPSLAQADPYLYYQQDIPAVDTISPETIPETVYLVRYVQEIFDPTDQHRQLLEVLGYQKTQELDFNGVVVWVYTHGGRLFASTN